MPRAPRQSVCSAAELGRGRTQLGTAGRTERMARTDRLTRHRVPAPRSLVRMNGCSGGVRVLYDFRRMRSISCACCAAQSCIVIIQCHPDC